MILVTGGTGLVGSHLLYQLTTEFNKITAIYRTKDRIEKVKNVFSFYTNNIDPLFEKITWVKADITDITSLNHIFCNGITEVYHCAALVSFNPNDYYKMRKINIEGTANIVNFCIDYKINKLCHVSSIATLGNTSDNSLITEETERNESQIESGYSITKYGSETEVWRASQEGVDIVIVNPGVILGYGFFEEGSGKLFTQISKGLNFYTKGLTGFVDVEDVVKVMTLLMKSSIKNERFILVSGNKTFKDILTTIAKGLNKKPPSIKINKLATNIFWRFNWVLSKITNTAPLLTKSSANAAQNKSFYNAKKIKETLNYNFKNIEETIHNICNKF